MRMRWKMLPVQPMKQEGFNGALLWTGEITDTNKCELLTLFASLWVVIFTLFLVAGHFWFKFSTWRHVWNPHNLYIFGKQNNLRRAPDCFLRPWAHPAWIILQIIQSLSFCESLKDQKTVKCFRPIQPHPRSWQKYSVFDIQFLNQKTFVFSGSRLTLYCQKQHDARNSG